MGILDAPPPPAKASKSIAGSENVTLTVVECGARVLTLTGATQTLTVTVPTGRAFTMTNATDFAHNIKRSGSSKSIVLDSGASMEVQS